MQGKRYSQNISVLNQTKIVFFGLSLITKQSPTAAKVKLRTTNQLKP